MYYNICGTLVTGTTTMFANIPFKPQHIYQILNDHKVTNLTGAPTMYRSIMAEGYDLPKMYNFHLKRVSCAGEALNKPALQFFEKIWNLKIREHYGQTEHGMMVCNHHHPSFTEHVPDGSMGTPLPGLRIALVDDNGNVVESPTSETIAQLAVDDTNSPINFFKGYYNSPEKTKERIVPASGIVVSLSGDRARVDQRGMYYYEGRSDDVINSSGFRIGPKEVEDIIMSHPSVRECGVVGKPDDLRGELVVAFVVVKQGKEAGKELEMELQQLVRNRLAKHQYPREIYFVESLPVTEAGKIKRGELRKRLLN
jgi:acetyl-CoA synthetase